MGLHKGQKNKGSFKKGMIPWNKGKKLSEEHVKNLSESHIGYSPTKEHRENLRKAHLGEKSHLWKGGITPINRLIRSSAEYRLWRTAVFERDNYTCIWCGKNSGNGIAVILHADHIKPFSIFPELRFAIDNGRTLCKECHMTTNTYAKKLNKEDRKLWHK